MPTWFIAVKKMSGNYIWKTNALTLKKLKIQVDSLNKRQCFMLYCGFGPSLIEKHLSYKTYFWINIYIYICIYRKALNSIWVKYLVPFSIIILKNLYIWFVCCCYSAYSAPFGVHVSSPFLTSVTSYKCSCHFEHKSRRPVGPVLSVAMLLGGCAFSFQLFTYFLEM